MLANPAAPRRSMDLHGICENSKTLGRPDPLPRLLKATLGVLGSFLDMSLGLVALLDAEGERELAVAGHLHAEGAARCFAARPERAVGQVVVTHVPLVVGDVARDEQLGPWDTSLWGGADESRFTFLGAPIHDRGRAIGALPVARGWQGRPSVEPDGDVRFLKMVASLVGQTVRLHRALARDRERLLEEQRRAEKGREPNATAPQGVPGIVGSSPALRGVLEKVRVAARRDVTVLLRGESGTGKELFARAIHTLSHRAAGPFVTLNCAALPESVLESELFGHEKGAFTGALAQRRGRFEMADKGTLFLDEIGEISASFQAKLLRVLQEGEFERVGGGRTLRVSVRVVAATNRNLEEAVARNQFRAELYYRLSVVPILLPPLRERRGDIPPLADEFLRRFNAENSSAIALDRAAYAVLAACQFPGNVRELENCIRRTATLAGGERIRDADFACRNDGCLSSLLWRPGGAQAALATPVVVAPDTAPPRAAPAATTPSAGCASCDKGEAGERERLVAAMERCGWVQAKAARMLNLTPRQMGYALRKHGIELRQL